MVLWWRAKLRNDFGGSVSNFNATGGFAGYWHSSFQSRTKNAIVLPHPLLCLRVDEKGCFTAAI